MEKISVVIPTYNRSHSIVKAVESVLDQTYPVSEVIVADDCSQDNTEEVLRQLNDGRVRYCRLPENRGAGGARNFGVQQAEYDLIAFHDSDDVWVRDKIEKQISYWKQHSDCGLIYCAYVMQLTFDIWRIVPNINRDSGLEGHILPELLFQNTVGAPTIFMEKAVFDAVGGFDESMRSLEDWDFAIRVAKEYPIGFVPEALIEVSASAGGVSSNPGAYYQSRCHMLRKHKAAYLETGMLETTVKDVLRRAELDNVLSQVEKMLMLYLAG